MAQTRTYWRPMPPANPVAEYSYAYLDETSVRRRMSSLDGWNTYFRDVTMAEYVRVANFYLKEWAPGHLGPWGLQVTGSSQPLPDFRYNFETIRTNNKQAWALASRPGSIQIVVSDYQKGHYTLTQTYGSSDLRVTNRTNTATAISQSPWISGSKGLAPYTTVYRGFQWHDQSALYSQTFERVTGTFEQTPMDLGFDFEAVHEFCQGIPARLKIDEELVTDCLADANTGWVDLMTSMAEMPEALKSALAGCTALFRLYKDAKNGEIRLANRAKRVRLKLARLEARSRAEFDTIREWEAHLQSIKTTKKSLISLMDAIANVWLTFRLGIYPLAKTIEATIDALMDIEKKFIRFRDQKRTTYEPPEIPGWTVSGQLEVVDRVFIKRGAFEEDMTKLVFTQNPILTMWELVPLSFVLDRYMNIGNFIAASVYRRNPRVTEGATYSWKINSGIQYTHDQSGATVNVTFDFYKRRVIDPSSLVCIPFPASRTRNQHLDHLALAWNLVIKRFTT